MLGSIVISCSGNEQEITGEQKEFSTDAAPLQDTTAFYSPPISDSLRGDLEKYFSDETIAAIESFVIEFDTIKTDTAFKQMYDNGISLFSLMYDEVSEPKTDYLVEALSEDGMGFYEVIDEFVKLNGQLGPLYFSCVAECTDFDFSFDLTILQKKAVTTNGKQDDEFMDLLMQIEDRQNGYACYGDFKAWHIQYTDISGSTRLGDNLLLDIVTRMQKMKSGVQLFNEEFDCMHSEIFDVLTSKHIYEYSPEEVQAEYTKILRLNYYTGEEKTSIEKCRDELKANPDSYQFNCKDGGCRFE